MIDFGTSQSPKSTRPLTTYWCPSSPGHPALRNNLASSLLLRTWLPYDWTPRSEAYFVFPLAQGTPGKQCGLAATGDYQPSLRSPWLAAFAPLLVASLALAGCASPPEEMGTVAECPPQTPQQDPRLPLAEKEITDLKAQVNRLKKEALAQTKQSQELQLQLAERHSRILQLQLALDQAVQEVVRAKARLRSRNSKAETVACRVPCDYITGSRKTWRKHNA
ncbi:hypothetical protein, partial [Thiolapillus sp.]